MYSRIYVGKEIIMRQHSNFNAKKTKKMQEKKSAKKGKKK